MNEPLTPSSGKPSQSNSLLEDSHDFSDINLNTLNHSCPIPRKLNFDSPESEKGRLASSSTPLRQSLVFHHERHGLRAFSPPYKKVRTLKLFDSPTTPETIIPINVFNPEGLQLKRRHHKLSPIQKVDYSNSSIEANISRKGNETSNDSQLNTTFESQFVEVELLDRGHFGTVYKCLRRLDGCHYAVKILPDGIVRQQNALREIRCNAVLSHKNVVRYYSSWIENNSVFIQLEYCNGGSLADLIENHRKNNIKMTENELRRLLLQLVNGLCHIHSKDLVHMDFKPANIFISRETRSNSMLADSSNCDDFDDLEESSWISNEEEIIYKIGDFGHATSLSLLEVEEGDSRYLPKEILSEDYSNLQKADIFALGLTMYEAAGGGPLPKNGDLWHKIRDGKLQDTPYSKKFNCLIKQMIDADPEQRPSPACILQHPYLCPFGTKSKAQLTRDLHEKQAAIGMLTQQLTEASKCINSLSSKFNNNNSFNGIDSSPLITTSKRKLRSSRTSM